MPSQPSHCRVPVLENSPARDDVCQIGVPRVSVAVLVQRRARRHPTLTPIPGVSARRCCHSRLWRIRRGRRERTMWSSCRRNLPRRGQRVAGGFTRQIACRSPHRVRQLPATCDQVRHRPCPCPWSLSLPPGSRDGACEVSSQLLLNGFPRAEFQMMMMQSTVTGRAGTASATIHSGVPCILSSDGGS